MSDTYKCEYCNKDFTEKCNYYRHKKHYCDYLPGSEHIARNRKIKRLQKNTPNGSFDVTTRLKYMITSINGDRDQKNIRDFVDNYLLAPDSRAFKKYYYEISPDIDTTITIDKDGYVQEGVIIPININFFWV